MAHCAGSLLQRKLASMTELAIHLTIILTIFLLAGVVKGVIGLGLPTIAMGLLGLLMPPAEAAALLVLPSLITNVWQLLSGPRVGATLSRLWPMMLAVFVSTVAASSLITASDPGPARAGLGAALVTYAGLGLLKLRMRVPSALEGWGGPVAGVATGLVTGATGVLVIPAVPYLAGLGLPRDDLVQALGLSFTVSTIALAIGLVWHAALPLQALGTSSGAVIPALIGMSAGGWLRRRVRPEMFRTWFFVGLAVLGCQLLWQAIRL